MAIFEQCVKPLIQNTFDGFNATILAYGQTGSGKTYTMGTALGELSGFDNDTGITPRAMKVIFDEMETSENFTYNLKVRNMIFTASLWFYFFSTHHNLFANNHR